MNQTNYKDWKDAEPIIIKIIQEHGSLPSFDRLRALGYGRLANAIRAYHDGFAKLRLKLGLSPIRVVNGYWDDKQHVQQELSDIVAASGRFPSDKELLKLGKSSLANAVRQHYGGFRQARKTWGYSEVRRTNGYWDDLSNVLNELESVIATLKHFPTTRELRAIGKGTLDEAMYRHGGPHVLRKQFGFASTEKQKGYWKKWKNVERELVEIVGQLGHFPSQNKLKELGKTSLAAALRTYHGGVAASRRKFGAAEGIKPMGYWQDWGNTERELRDAIAQLGHFPSRAELKRLKKDSLSIAMRKYHGGMREVQARMGYQPKGQPRGYWKEWEHVESAFHNVVQKLGYFPSQRELRSLGYASLVRGVRYHGGLNVVRERMEFGFEGEKERLEALLREYIS